VTELPYLRYPRWARRPRDLFDPADGVVLGQGWGPLECRGGEPARRAEDGAELAVNPLGQNRRVVRLELSTDRPGRLEVLNRAGRVVATAAVGGRREVCLTLPTDPARVNLFRLRCRGGGTFTAFCPAAGR
jgi:hypothetical protein